MKKGISPVVASALLLVVAIVGVVGFQTWFNNYSSETFIKVEHQSSQASSNSNIETIIDSILYFKNGNTNNLTITSIKIDGINCNINQTIIPGVTGIDVRSCLINSSTTSPEIIVLTRNKIYAKKILTTLPLPSPLGTLSFTVNDTTIAFGSSLTLNWSIENATSCTASGDWSNSKPTSNIEVIPNIFTNSIYILSCTNGVDIAIKNVSISVYDPYWSSVSLYTTFDNNYTDYSNIGNILTPGAGISINTTNKVFGTGAARFTGIANSGLAATPTGNEFIFGTGDFTIECWAYIESFTGTNGYMAFMDFRDALVATPPVLSFNLSGYIELRGTGYMSMQNNGTAMVTDTWYHIAYSRSSGIVKVFIDGVERGSWSDSGDYPFGGTQYKLGDNHDSHLSYDSPFHGLLDECRVTKGVGRYTTTFTKPITAFPKN